MTVGQRGWRGAFGGGAVAVVLVACLLTPAGAASLCRGEKVTIEGTGGADEITGTSKRDVIDARGGNDVIFSLGGSDLVCAGPGSDEVYASGGADVVYGSGGSDGIVGGPGNDVIRSGGSADYLNGGQGDDLLDAGIAGFDYVDFRTSAGPVRVDLAAETATGDGNDVVKRAEMIAGSLFDDELLGASRAFELYLGLTGNDTIDGRDGFDQLIFEESEGGVTADLTSGSASGEGEDTFSSIESLVGSNFDDTMLGTDASDDLYGLSGNDTIDGRGGNDYILGQAGDDDLAGGAGPYDMIDFDADAPAVTVDMTSGLSTGNGSDQVSGFEIIGGTPLDDTLVGSDADDLFYPYGGDDAIDGAGGTDLVLYDRSGTPIHGDLAAGVATGQGTDTLAALEGFVGGSSGDVFIGDDNDNVFIGGPGPDDFSGGGGDDYMDGGANLDEMDGGPGTFDMVDFHAAPQGVTADLETETAAGDGADRLIGVETLFGSPHDDAFSGDALGNFLFGMAGADDLRGRGGDDGLDGGEGNDSLDGGAGTDDCFAGETEAECESAGQTQDPEIDVEALQQLAAILAEVVGGGPG